MMRKKWPGLVSSVGLLTLMLVAFVLPMAIVGAGSAPTVTTLSAVDIAMDKDGVTTGSFSGNLTALGGAESVYHWFEYGLDTDYGSYTDNVSDNETGVKTALIPEDLTPGETYHFRFVAQNIDGMTEGDDEEFTLTMPTIATVEPSELLLQGEVSDLGVSSNCTVYFQWSYNKSYSNTTESQTANETGIYTWDTSSLPTGASNVIYYRFVASVGDVIVYGDGMALTSPGREISQMLWNLIPVIVLFCFWGTAAFYFVRGEAGMGLVMFLIGILLMAVLVAVWY